MKFFLLQLKYLAMKAVVNFFYNENFYQLNLLLSSFNLKGIYTKTATPLDVG